ncbi:nuclear transport factor 2 family protein [Streptomyces olivoreticuli]|uniref:nuclear transport factor 2 family protein n=1 Tax=Streptomyces olivoreticuli TaxID=68246 RepID=UPI000E289533|nr:nuclear transport factor 2 family protein [Streptomyces olivoreticuli]
MNTVGRTAAALPEVFAAHIKAVNAFDLDAIMATFCDDAVVNDARREFVGTASIRAWVRRELVDDKVTMDVTEVAHHGTLTIVRARYDGEYDKTNLPEELVLTSYLTVADGKISSLIIVHNEPSPY